jgi:hypothetical protein
VSSLNLEFGVAARTGRSPGSLSNAQLGKRPLLARRTTLGGIDTSNDLFSDPAAKLLLRPDVHVAKALGVSLEVKSASPGRFRLAA